MARSSPSKKKSKRSKYQRPYTPSSVRGNKSSSSPSPSASKAMRTRKENRKVEATLGSIKIPPGSIAYRALRNERTPDKTVHDTFAKNAVANSGTTSDLTELSSSPLTAESLEQHQTAAEAFIFDPFYIRADRSSVETIRKLVDDLNCCIDHAIMNILEVFKPQSNGMDMEQNLDESSTNGRLNRKGISSLDELRTLLSSTSELKEGSRARVMDLIMHDLICNLIYDAYFHGKHFWGINKDRNIYNEKIYDTILKQEPDVARKWRSITINAQFELDREADIERVIKLIVLKFEDIITKAYRDSTSGKWLQNRDVAKVVGSHQRLIHKVVKKSHSLSLQIQRDMLLSSLQVVHFPPLTMRKIPRIYSKAYMTRVSEVDAPSQTGDIVLGMFKLGLTMAKEGDMKLKKLIKPVVITNSDAAWAVAINN